MKKMKKRGGWVAWSAGLANALALAAGFAFAPGCHSGSGSLGPSSNPTATVGVAGTPTATPVLVSTGSNTFIPTALTVTSNTTVKFNLGSIHTAHIDDGSGTGTCSSFDLTGNGATHAFVGPSGTAFHIHCDVHSPCGAASCSACTGMVMTIFIQ
jgi:plastocyanin